MNSVAMQLRLTSGRFFICAGIFLWAEKLWRVNWPLVFQNEIVVLRTMKFGDIRER